MAEYQMTLMGRQSMASDLSGSMVNKVGKAKEAALQFFETANPQDEFFLVTFTDHAQLTSTFTSNVEDLASRMLSTSAKGRTALLDAILSSLLHTFNIGSRNNGLRHEVLAFCKSFSLSVFGTWIEEKAQSCLGGGVYDDA
jgi:von Willebrand factor type A domain